MSDDKNVKKKVGFAAMSPEKRRELSSLGGKSAHARGTAHRFNSESAREAARVAREMGHGRAWTPEQAREAGKKGAQIVRARREARAVESVS